MLNDFGISRILQDQEYLKTETGIIGGTLEYNSPERIKQEASAS